MVAKASVKRSPSLSAYVLFGKAMRSNSPDITMKELGVQWKALDAGSKATYQKQAEEVKAARTEEVGNGWLLKFGNEEALDKFADKLAKEAVKAFLLEQMALADEGKSEETVVKSVGKIVSTAEVQSRPTKAGPKVTMLLTPAQGTRGSSTE